MDIHGANDLRHIQNVISAAIEAGTMNRSSGMAPISIQMERRVSPGEGHEHDIESVAVTIAIQLSQAEADAAQPPPLTIEQGQLDRSCPVMHYRRSMVETRCAICLNDFKPNRRVRRLPCGHLFCSVCVAQWLVNQAHTCPTCRSDVRT